MKPPKQELRDKLYDYYIKQNLTVIDVSHKLNMPFESVKYYLNKFKIKKAKENTYKSYNKSSFYPNSSSKPPNLDLLEKLKDIDLYNVSDDFMYVSGSREINENTEIYADGEKYEIDERPQKELDIEENKKYIRKLIRKILKRRREE